MVNHLAGYKRYASLVLPSDLLRQIGPIDDQGHTSKGGHQWGLTLVVFEITAR